ncbi:MAG: hypothetical protein IJK40_02600 [Clostridia bacterium]|nr:hypothetical protein [Clostridia bacterium]
MAIRITCPYCFKAFGDDEVMFRSEFVNHAELDDLAEADQIEARTFSPISLNDNYMTPYKEWWTGPDKTGNNVFNSSERDPAEQLRDPNYVLPYRRVVIDPKEPFWQKYLVPQNERAVPNSRERYLIRGSDNMVCGIKLRATRLHPEMLCSRRVCPYCNNPLPDNYGKAPVITIPIIGVTNSGKTVYMSTLLRKINYYMTKVGYNDAKPSGNGTYAFAERNKVEAGKKLPDPTQAEEVQQPIIFNMTRDIGNNRIATYTVVLYDLAGEYFNNNPMYDITKEYKHRRPLLENANGIILLIDPKQLTETDGLSFQSNGRQGNPAVTALNIINQVLQSAGKVESKVTTPLAVCIPKSDTEQFLYFFDERTQELATQSATYDIHRKGIPAEQYNALSDSLYDALELNPDNGIISAANNYEMKRFFAFSATGGAPIDEETHQMIGTPTPERLEDPLMWLLAKNGYCEVNGVLSRDVRCPACGSYHTRFRITNVREKAGLFRSRDVTYHYICLRCKQYFNLGNEIG